MENRPYFVNRFGDRYLYEVNRNAFNQLGASAVFGKHFGHKLERKDFLTIVVGTDSGALVRHVQRTGVPEGSRFLFLELDALLPTIRAELADETLDDTLHIVGENQFAESLQDVRFADYANIGRINLVDSIGVIDGYFDGYREFSAEIRRQLDSALWAYNSSLSNPTFVRCQLKNLVEEHVPAAALRDSFPGRTAVLLGGGPSLDDVLPWLRDHQHDVFIFAVSRVCRRLAEAGVTPHIVVSIDPTELSFDISKELLLLDPRVVLAHANHVVSELLAQWRGRSVFLDQRYPWETPLNEDNVRSAGPTVTNTAFSLACAMGFRRIVFGGIDLCNSPDGYSHASGSNEHDAGPRFGGGGMRTRTNAGNEAETSPDFFNGIRSFGAQALDARRQGIAIINPAPHAAVIDGVDFVPLDELVIEAGASEPFAVLHGHLPADTPAMRISNLQGMKHELARANGRLRKIIDLAEQALACNDGLFGRNGKSADFAHKKRMDKIERQLDNKYRDLSTIVRMFSARAFLAMPPSDREWTDEEIEQAGRTYYEAYRDNAREILDLVTQAQHRLDAALEEQAPSPDFERLFARWQQDAIPGRAMVLRHRRPDLEPAMSDTVRLRLDAFEAEARRVIDTRETAHAIKMRNEVSLTPVRARLQVLFKERNIGELHKSAQRLGQMNEPEAVQLAHLAQGYAAELLDDPQLAFDCYAQVIEDTRRTLADGAEEAPNPRLEDALQRMVVVAMNQQWNDQALLLLETLSGLSPVYQPQFAELLRLSGQVDAAITVYNDYLGKAPGDHLAMLRLGRLYQTIGAVDAARTAFNYVLQHEPDNKAAQALLEQSGTAA